MAIACITTPCIESNCHCFSSEGINKYKYYTGGKRPYSFTLDFNSSGVLLMEAHEGMSKKEFNNLLKLAQKGDVNAQIETGIALRYGYGIEKNGSDALKWFKKAAETGDADGMCLVGHMYFIGDCGERDYEKALEWYRKSVNFGCIQCAAAVNEVYIMQAVVKGNFKEAKTQLDVRKEVWNIPLTDENTFMINVILESFHKLQNLIVKKLPECVFPPHSNESLHTDNDWHTIWYKVKTNDPNVYLTIFEYCLNDHPPFLATAFYANRHGVSQEKAKPVLEKYSKKFRYQYEGENFGFASIREMTIEDFLDEKILSELAEKAVKVYSAIDKAQRALAGITHI